MRTCEHAATEQLGQKTRRQDFCRRLMEKILHHQTHLESWPSCSPFNIGRKNLSPKQRSWMTQILHRRTGLQKTTLKRGCGGTCHNVLSHMPAPVQDFFHQQYTQKVCKYPNSKRFQKVHTYIHTCIHANKHTYIHTYRQTDRQTYIPTYVHTYIHVCMHTYTHAECVCFDSARTVHAQCTPQCTPQCTRRKCCK